MGQCRARVARHALPVHARREGATMSSDSASIMPLTRGAHGCELVTPEGRVPIRVIMGIGLNYAQHAREQGAALPERPVLFMKNPFAAALDGEPIRVPTICQDREQVDFEGELAFVILRPVRDVPPERALEAIGGYAAANDVSARWWQKTGSGGQFCRGKGFDTFCPMSAFVASSAVRDPQALRLVTRVNGTVMQDSSTADMIFPCARLVAELSRGTTLLPGTVVLTGTPEGVGMARRPPVFLRHGDTVRVEIEGVGSVTNRVEFE
jgi:2-keto-4-pentenoate hydratase/2-oxohepta-3-ene-1,7-dioic acid hydratase in catechol pathway